MKIISWGNISRQLEWFMSKAMKRENYRDDVLDTMEKIKDKNFSSEWRQNVINPKWAPLSVWTALARAKRTWYYKRPSNRPSMLRWTGNLQDNIKRVKSQYSCQMIFNTQYAIYHQDGKWAKHRALFEFNPSVKAEIMRAIQKKFNEEIGIRNARKSS